MIKQFIKRLRIDEKVSADELARGICSAEALRKFERGEKEPKKLRADALWQRLGKSTEKFEVYLDHDEYVLACERQEIQMLIRKGELEQAEKKLRAYRTEPDADGRLHRQFVLLQRAEIARRRSAPYEEQLRLVLEGLEQTIEFPVNSPQILKEHCFDLLELLLLERYAFLLEAAEPEAAIQWYRELCRYLGQEDIGGERDNGEEKCRKNAAKRQRPRKGRAYSRQLLPPILSRLAALAGKAGMHQVALRYAQEGSRIAGGRHTCLPLFVMLEEQKLEAMRKRGQELSAGEAGCLVLLKDLVCRQPAWLENIYPDYAERNLFSVNEVLRERRLANAWSEDEMALECDVRTIKGAESKKRMLQSAKKNLLFKMLRLTTVKYSGNLVTARYSDFLDMEEMIQSYDVGSYGYAEEIYKRIREGLTEDEVINRQFIRYWDIRFGYRKKKLSEKEYREAMWELLGEALPHLEDAGARCAFTKYEREILRELAWTAGESGLEQLEYILRAQYDRMRESMVLTGLFPEYAVSLACCLGESARRQGDFIAAGRYLGTALEEMYFMQEDFWLGALCFQRFRVEEDVRRAKGMHPLSEEDEETCWVRLAYAVYKIYVKNSAWVQFIEEYLDGHYGDAENILRGLM